MTHQFPWQCNKSSYSSSPSSGSSGGSSSCYSRSPDDLSVDSLISSLLQVVSSEDFGSTSSMRFSQNSIYGGSRSCRDCCTEGYSELCTANRLLNNTASGFEDEPQSSRPQNRGRELSSPPSYNYVTTIPSPMPFYCDAHQDSSLKFYCQSCSKPFCAECDIHLHRHHVTQHLKDALEIATTQANKVLNESRLGITVLRDELESIQLAAETLDLKARQATADVMLCVRRVASALETREKELLSRIEKARTVKYAALKVRDDGLREGINRLTQATDKLADALESKALISNPFNLLVTKDLATAESFQIRQNRQVLPSPEENWISFTGLEANALQAIANLGSVVINNPGPIGDRRAVRGRGNSPKAFPPQCSIFPLIPVPHGRAIPGNPFPVIVKPDRLSSKEKLIRILGTDGEPNDNLCRPWGIACDKDGHIIVADRSNNRIQIYRQDGLFIRKFGTHGTLPGQFDRPAGVAVDSRRRVIVADKDNHRIQVLSMEGVFLLGFGEKGSRFGQFNYPWDVAVNADCQIVVSDTRNHRVQLFSPEGIFLRKYGYESAPNMWKHFDSPRGVAFNPEGNVVTTDFNNHRVIIIEADFTSARVFDCEATPGTKQFLRPQGLVIDDEGNVVVADSRNHRIQVFDSAGNLRYSFGTYGKGPEEMDRPSGIALCLDGSIAVVDFGNNRVVV